MRRARSDAEPTSMGCGNAALSIKGWIWPVLTALFVVLGLGAMYRVQKDK